jgi:hypothetical protein
MKVEIEIPEEELVADIEKKVRQYVLAEAASWVVRDYIVARIREQWQQAADALVAEALASGPALRAKITEEIEKKLRAQLAVAMKQAREV